MPSLRIVEQLDLAEHTLAGFVACFVDLPPDPFGFKRSEEALSHGIIVAVAASAHAGFQIVVFQEVQPCLAGELRTLTGMDHHTPFRVAPPDGHQQSVQDQRCMHARVHRPPDDFGCIQINGDGEIESALMSADIGDVGEAT